MFYNTSTFNQGIGTWDVSNGVSFVSIAKTNIDIAILFMNCMTHVANKVLTCSPMQLYRVSCFLLQKHSTKTSAVGMCPKVVTL